MDTWTVPEITQNTYIVIRKGQWYERVAARVAGRLFAALRELQDARGHEGTLHKHCVDLEVGTWNRFTADQIIRQCQFYIIS